MTPAQLQHPHLLRLVLTAALHRDLEVAAAQRRVVAAGVDLEWIVDTRVAERLTLVKLLRLPRRKPVWDLLGKPRGIGRRIERQRRDVAGELVLTVLVGRRAGEAGGHDERPEHPDDPDDVAEDRFLVPLLLRLDERLRVPVVERSSEQLTAAVERTRLQQLLGADDAERLEQLRPDDVLAAFAPVERQIGCPCVIAACQARDQGRVFIIGMGRDVQDAGRRPEP